MLCVLERRHHFPSVTYPVFSFDFPSTDTGSDDGEDDVSDFFDESAAAALSPAPANEMSSLSFTFCGRWSR